MDVAANFFDWPEDWRRIRNPLSHNPTISSTSVVGWKSDARQFAIVVSIAIAVASAILLVLIDSPFSITEASSLRATLIALWSSIALHVVAVVSLLAKPRVSPNKPLQPIAREDACSG